MFVKSYNGNKHGIIEMIVTNVFDAKLLSKVIISNLKNIQKNASNVRLESDVRL